MLCWNLARTHHVPHLGATQFLPELRAVGTVSFVGVAQAFFAIIERGEEDGLYFKVSVILEYRVRGKGMVIGAHSSVIAPHNKM